MPDGKKVELYQSSWLGTTFPAWLHILRKYRHRPKPGYLALFALISASSLMNWFLQLLQEIFFFHRIRRTSIADPVFIVGHWRSGTTLLHEMMACDDRFSYPTYYTCLQPAHFLLTERLGAAIMRALMPKSRVVDAMASSPDLPLEDEVAMLLLGAPSPVANIAFPEARDNRGVALSHEELCGETNRWQSTFLWFLKRSQVRDSKRLILKSPGHSFRVRTLFRLFPDAKFIRIQRNPLHVALSAISSNRNYAALLELEPGRSDIERQLKGVLELGRKLYDDLETASAGLPAENIHTLKYEDLVDDPVTAIAEIYAALSLGDFQHMRPALEKLIEDRSGYTSERRQPDPAHVDLVKREWGDLISRLGY